MMDEVNENNNVVNRPRRRRLLLILVAAIAVVAILSAIGAAYLLPRRTGGDAWIRIPAGASVESIRDSLVSSLGSVDGERVFSLWQLQNGDAAVAHGAYLIADGEYLLKAARRIATGRQTPVNAVWSDARSLDATAERLTSRLECSAEDFVKACDEILPDSGYARAEFMAAFLPNKYEVYWTVSPRDLIGKLLDYRRRFWTEERRQKAAALGLSEVEVATLASIVEEETAKVDERPKIARLYLNRLKQGMMLQADPTVKFAVGDPTLRRISGAHLKCQSPYNTYQNHGLPPGPIRIADQRTIDAVLDAPEHDYIFMCAKEDFSGYHNFAVDYATHQANARRYQAELDRRGIRN